MDNVKNWAVGLIVVVALVLGFLGYNKAITFSAVTGPDRFFPCESSDGIKTCFSRKGFTSATTTVCAIQSPNATSTGRIAVRMNTSSTTASVVTVAKAATAYATTTPFNLVSVAANAQVTIISSTTPETDGSISRAVFGPNQWFVVGMQGGVSGETFSPVGACQAVFEVI